MFSTYLLIDHQDVCEIHSVQFSCLVSLEPHGLQHARPPCPSPMPRVYSNSCPSSRWYHPSISSSVIPFSSHLQSFPTSGSFPMSQLFTSGGQVIGDSASASALPMNIQYWFPLGLTGLITLQRSKWYCPVIFFFIMSLPGFVIRMIMVLSFLND